MEKGRLVIFDGNAIVHRAYHAFERTKPLTTKSGELVSAVYGFGQMLLKAINDLKPTHYAIAFDKAAPTFRHKMFEEYKAQRPKTPEDLSGQFGRVKELVKAFHMPIFEIEGYEADDVLGTLAKQASEKGLETVIVTGDADTMQLVGPSVKVLYPKPRGSFSDTMLYDEAAVEERYGIKPEHVADLKALEGDVSDNIPGVPGVGEKTAVKLIKQFGGIDEIYKHLGEVEPPRLQALLRDNEVQARQSKELATIIIETPITLNLDECKITHYDRSKVADLFRELGFYSLLNKLPDDMAAQPPPPKVGPPVEKTYHIVNTGAALDEMVNVLTGKPFAFDLEATDLDPMLAEIVGLSFSTAPGEAYYVPVGHIGLLQMPQLPLAQVAARLGPFLEDPARPKLAHNANYDMTLLAQNGLTVNGLTFDTMIAAHLLGDKALSLKAVAFERLGIEMTPITDLIGTGAKQIPMSRVEIEKAADYACADADMTVRLAELLEPQLKREELWKLFTEVELPLVPVLVKMQRVGVALNADLLREMSHRLGEQLLKLEKQIYDAIGHQFNINSTQQLSEILFTELKLPVVRKARGRASTEASVLEELKGSHPVIDFVIEYRQLAKLKSTYVDALPGLINPKTKRVHTSFNQTRTATGRLSSSDPNLQNIPVRGELGREIRRAFIAPPGTKLLAGDYSQIDLRVLAHLSQDTVLLSSFERNEDIHSATASRLFNVDVSAVTGDMRRLAKTVNFGVIYGISEYGLEQATELSREEATSFIAAYFEQHPGVKKYLDSTKEQAREKGYVQTMLGRRRYIPEINSPNRILREAAERMAINMPVQGTSADIIKLAMLNLDREMAVRRLKSRMLLQVHDELIFEVPEDEMTAMRELVPQIMDSALKLNVPVKVDIKTGQNWGEME